MIFSKIKKYLILNTLFPDFLEIGEFRCYRDSLCPVGTD